MKTKGGPRRRLPEDIAEAMTVVLDFFWQDQAKDYLSRNREDQQHHVFCEMLTVRRWLTARQRNSAQGTRR
jgi:hypothetical protein